MISRTSPYRTHTGRYSAVTYCRLLVFTALTAHVFFLYENRGVADTSEPPFFETTIQPIFSKHCTDCHGPEVQEGGLDLSSAKGLLQGSESGPTFRAGNAEQSTLFGLIQRGDMPPAEEEQLSEAEIEAIRIWIESGAPFQDAKLGDSGPTQHDVIPILLLRCVVCHGGRSQEAGLDLRTRESLLRGGKSGPAVVSGDPQKSLLIQRIHKQEMPPRRALVRVSVKPMEATELTVLEQWIAQGLPKSDLQPDIANQVADPLVSNEDRRFWSFQSPVAAPLPEVPLETISTSIDSFILRSLRNVQLHFSPPATRSVLVRRLSFNLTGLPPTPSEVEQFLADPTPDAYEKLVDRLLASPRHGERWATHWLDVAGYADSEGSQNEDRVRPHMWRYRDYVIRALNQDKPYDRFLHEQLAGDELTEYENVETIDDAIYDNLVATGFLRTAPDRTFAAITAFVPDRLEVIADEMQIFGSAILGLTIHCARCHTHKFDPIPQRDYYRLTAIFKDGFDEHDWLKSQGPRTLNFVTTSERTAWQANKEQVEQEAAVVQEKITAEENEEKKKQLEAELQAINQRHQPEPRIRALWSRGVPSPTYVLLRGDYKNAGRLVGPGVPSVLTDGKTPFMFAPPWQDAQKTGRRLALAKWLTEPSNPLTARVMANRIWKHHFGRGLVTSLDNFGTTGASPSHPELIDWLAVEFVRRQWSMKSLHRMLVTSTTYRQSSTITEELAATDLEGTLLSRMPLRRMEGEVLRDALLQISNRLQHIPYGPADSITEMEGGLITTEPRQGGWRRSVFALHRRTKMPTILENFDYPQMGPNCLDRRASVVAPQALHLLNNALVSEWADSFAMRVASEVGEDPAKQIRRAYQIALGRLPREEEQQIGLSLYDDCKKQWLESGVTDAPQRAFKNVCHALMNSAAFLYID